MQDKATLNPTPDQTFEIVGQGAYDFVRVLTHSKQLQRQGRVEEACNERFHAFQRISELLPEDEEVILEWEDPNTRAALEVIHASAIDHFLINDFEMSTAMLELLLELDPETIWRQLSCWRSITWQWRSTNFSTGEQRYFR